VTDKSVILKQGVGIPLSTGFICQFELHKKAPIRLPVLFLL